VRPGRSASADVVCDRVGVVRGGVTVLADVDLVVARGDWVALVGPNGAGKTTLVQALAGLLPASGSMSVGGHDPARAGRQAMARSVAVMPQRPIVPDGTSVREFVLLGRTPHLPRFGTESARDRAAVHAVIERLSLGGLANRRATELSGGELQRVVLARALAQEPQVLLLDEPTSALDIGHQQHVLDLVETLRAQDGITVVAAMHDLTLAAHYSRRLVLLEAGRVLADGPPIEVLDPALLARVYGARVEILNRPGGPVVVPATTGSGS